MAKVQAQEIGGFQVETVSEVPAEARKARGIYGEIIEKAPVEPKALKINFDDPKKASTRVTGLRGYLKRHQLTEQFTVVRQKAEVFISKKAEASE